MTKVRYQTSSIEREFNSSVTVQDILADRSILGALGAPTDVYAVSGGNVLEGSETIADYSLITLEKRGSSKA